MVTIKLDLNIYDIIQIWVSLTSLRVYDGAGDQLLADSFPLKVTF